MLILIHALLRIAARSALLAWWRWALREIPQHHEDVPEIVLRIGQLQRALAADASLIRSFVNGAVPPRASR